MGLNLKGFKAMQKSLEKMEKRSKSLKPLATMYDTILSARHRGQEWTSKERLQPSLASRKHPEHSYRFIKSGIVRHGSTVPYAAAHDKWRLEHGLPSFLEVEPKVQREILIRTAKWVLTGSRKKPKLPGEKALKKVRRDVERKRKKAVRGAKKVKRVATTTARKAKRAVVKKVKAVRKARRKR